MPEYVCYSNDVAALVDELAAAGWTQWLTEQEEGEYTLGGPRTPLIYSWPQAIAVFDITEEEVDALSNLEILGHYEGEDFVAVGPTAQAKYDMLYPRTPIVKTGLGGVEVTVTPPSRIGGLA